MSKSGFRQKAALSASILVAVLLAWSAFSHTSTGSPFSSSRLPYFQPSSGQLSRVGNDTLGFQRIFAIGLASRTDHRDALELSAAVTNLSIDWIDGVVDVDNKSLPSGDGQRFGKQAVGSWRAHLNALNHIVRNGISSALIIEDDADWDIRIKQQLEDFAVSSNALLQRSTQRHASENEDVKPITFQDLPKTPIASHSPYGDDWDILWLGQCGMTRPGASRDGNSGLPLNYVVHTDDETVPEPVHVRDFRGKNEGYLAGTDFQNHTRLFHHPQHGFCSVAYAVTQRGARNLLWYAGIRAFDDWFDKLLPQFCEGENLEGLKRPMCITTQPTLFDQHAPKGDRAKSSDIFLANSGVREAAKTPTIRWSTRMNLAKLLNGDTDGFDDQWPDSKDQGS